MLPLRLVDLGQPAQRDHEVGAVTVTKGTGYGDGDRAGRLRSSGVAASVTWCRVRHRSGGPSRGDG